MVFPPQRVDLVMLFIDAIISSISTNPLRATQQFCDDDDDGDDNEDDDDDDGDDYDYDKCKQVAQLSQSERAAGWVSYGRSGRLELGYNIYRHYRSIFNHCDIIGQSNSVKKMQNKGYYAVTGHSRSSRSVSIESPYATFY